MSHPKNKHHIIPATYLRGFIDKKGKLYEYRKDDCKNPNYNIPSNIGHRRKYYSQPMPNGKIDNNTLEDFFDREVESHWNDILKIIHNKNRFNNFLEGKLFQFVSMLRVRVPAARDMVEQMMAERVKSSSKILDEQGVFGKKPESLRNNDWLKDINVSIDPHQSIHAMADMIKGFSLILENIGFRILCNSTELSIITSDNPTIYFDPDIPRDKIYPYTINKNSKRIELIFPIDKKHILHGHTDYKYEYTKDGLKYYDLGNKQEIKSFNNLISKFGYEKLYSSSVEHYPIIKKFSSVSPVLNIEKIILENGIIDKNTTIFGKRSKLPKWKRKK